MPPDTFLCILDLNMEVYINGPLSWTVWSLTLTGWGGKNLVALDLFFYTFETNGVIQKIPFLSNNYNSRQNSKLNQFTESLLNFSFFALKGVFAKNERGYRLIVIKKRFWLLLILLLSVASIRRKLLKTSHTE